MSVLIWVQTVCKGKQQTAKVSASMERVKINFDSALILLDCVPGPLLSQCSVI